MSEEEFLLRFTALVTPVKTQLADGKARQGWPNPWVSGEHRRYTWGKMVQSSDKWDRQMAADLFVEETHRRWLCASNMVSDRYGGNSPEPITVRLDGLDAYCDKARAKYAETFGAQHNSSAWDEPIAPHASEAADDGPPDVPGAPTTPVLVMKTLFDQAPDAPALAGRASHVDNNLR